MPRVPIHRFFKVETHPTIQNCFTGSDPTIVVPTRLFWTVCRIATHLCVSGRSLESLVPPNVDKEALHLLKELLVMNTKLRPTATRALDHDFLSDCPVLPTAADSNGDGSADEFVAGLGAIDFR